MPGTFCNLPQFHTRYSLQTRRKVKCAPAGMQAHGLGLVVLGFRFRERVSDCVRNRVGVRVRVGGQVSHRHSQDFLWGCTSLLKFFLVVALNTHAESMLNYPLQPCNPTPPSKNFLKN